MTMRATPNPFLRNAILFGLAAIAVYLVMLNATLATITDMTGLAAFDMRPGGYGAAEAHELLTALGEIGRRYYLTRQIPLDLAYPALLALTLISITRIPYGHGPLPKTGKIAVATSIGFALADYLENLGIAAMLWQGPGISDNLVLATSAASVTKAALTSIAIPCALLVVIRAGYHARFRSGSA